MNRIAVLTLVVTISVPLLASPTRGQSTDEIERLIAELEDEDPGVRANAAWYLGAVLRAVPAVPALVVALSDKDEVVRERAAEALAEIGPKAVPALGAALTDERASVRLAAAESLGEIGPEASPAVPALIAALSDTDMAVRESAADALGVVGPRAAQAAPALIASLSDQDWRVRRASAQALGGLGPKASQVPDLIAALSDENAEVRSWTAWAMGEIGPEAAPAVPALISALSDEDSKVRLASAGALRRIGPKAAPAAFALTVSLSDENKGVRLCAFKALSDLGAEAVPALAGGLLDHEEAHESAASVLGQIGVDLKAKGEILWWVVPRVYWKQLVGLLLMLATWFALAARFPLHRPTRTPKHVALMAVSAVVPVGLCCSAVYYAITRDWAQGFLPDAVTVVPFPVAAVLSVALVCTLPAVWVCQRKTLAPEAVGPTPPVEPGPTTTPTP